MLTSGAHSHGLGISLSELLDYAKKIEKRAQEHEIKMAPLVNETYALQVAALQTQQQMALQEEQLQQRAEQSGELMSYLPWVLGGLGALGLLVLIVRSRRRR